MKVYVVIFSTEYPGDDEGVVGVYATRESAEQTRENHPHPQCCYVQECEVQS